MIIKKITVACLALSLASCATVKDTANCANAQTAHDSLKLTLLFATNSEVIKALKRSLIALELACPYLRNDENGV